MLGVGHPFLVGGRDDLFSVVSVSRGSVSDSCFQKWGPELRLGVRLGTSSERRWRGCPGGVAKPGWVSWAGAESGGTGVLAGEDGDVG